MSWFTPLRGEVPSIVPVRRVVRRLVPRVVGTFSVGVIVSDASGLAVSEPATLPVPALMPEW